MTEENKGQPPQKEVSHSIEAYLPPDYPQLLFHGTSSNNSERVKDQGLRGGILSTWLFDTFDTRFYRDDNGRLLITEFDGRVFETKELRDKLNPYVYYLIKHGTGDASEWFEYERIDTDGLPVRGEAKSDQKAAPEKFGCVQFSQEQFAYFRLINSIISGEFIGEFHSTKAAQVAEVLSKHGIGLDLEGLTADMVPRGLDLGDFLDYQAQARQRMVAEFLGIGVDDLASWDRFQQVMAERYADEEAFIDQLLLPNFPGEFNWTWKNLQGEDKELLRNILLQIYQVPLVKKVKAILKGQSPTKTLIFTDGEGAQGYLRLLEEMNLS